MPDLSNLPTYLSIPFLLVFAVLLLISRFLDVFEKWDAWKAKRVAKKSVDKSESARQANEVEDIVQVEDTAQVEETAAPPEPSVLQTSDQSDVLTGKQVFGYAYVGAIAIPLIYAIVYYFIAPHEALKQQHLYTLMTWMVYAAIAAILILYLRKKFSSLNQHVLACFIAGNFSAGVIAIPLNMVSTIMAYSHL